MKNHYVKYSNFVNCTSIDAYGISFYNGSCTMQYCSISDCSCRSAFIVGSATDNLIEFTILKNINVSSTVFSVAESGSMTLRRCLLLNITGSTHQAIQEETIKGELLIMNKFLSTAFCQAENAIDEIKVYFKLSNNLCIRNMNYSNFLVILLI